MGLQLVSTLDLHEMICGKMMHFLSGIPEHQTLVSGTSVILLLGNVDTTSNVCRLLLQSHQQVHGLAVEPFAGVVVSNVLHCVPHNLLIINMSLACDLSAHHDHASLCHCLAGNLCVRILLEMGVQDCVRHLVAHLVRVALPHRFGSEKELSSVLCLHHGLLHVAHVGSHLESKRCSYNSH